MCLDLSCSVPPVFAHMTWHAGCPLVANAVDTYLAHREE